MKDSGLVTVLRQAPLVTQLLLALAVTGVRPTFASTLVTDCTDGAASTTLRNLVTSASSGDTIDASACANSTITLASGEIAVAQNSLTVVGPSSGTLTISGNQAGRVFAHTGSGTLDLQHIIIANGKLTQGGPELYGGCIFSNGSVQLDYATLSGCNVLGSNDGDNAQGGAIFAKGSVTADHSTISGNSAKTIASRGYAYGGGVDALSGFYAHHSVISGNTAYVTPALLQYGAGGGVSTRRNIVLQSTTISGNSAGHGGGIYVQYGSISVDTSTISANTALEHGGGMLAHGTLTATNSTFDGNAAGKQGGGIYSSTTTNLTNSTISGNSVGTSGGGLWAHDVNVYFCTFFANSYTAAAGKGAGIYFTNSATVNASIITGNGSDDIDASGNITVNGAYNIVAASGVGVPGDTMNCGVNLGPLANFGGSTKTLPLLTGSCAIDKGPFSPSPTSDQRGYPRLVQLVWPAPRADIGAFEKQSASDPDYIFINGFGAAGSD